MVGFRRDDELIGSGEGCETRRKTGDECTVFRVSKCRRVFHSGRRLDCVVVQLMYCTEFHDCFCGNIHLGVIEGGDHEYDIHLT
ncbi:hypothetical protein Y032_0439g1500 [Ancylostoma ceylanicum]|uniref:Uncharacterized protein n=1 Tax=Ancylostoma ceylanicum TaxID=53326 RepID=A0A016X1H9_9BILA|nr:hypothetical protein Y032_0439g1500 [Ancylostoma ceylanicum]